MFWGINGENIILRLQNNTFPIKPPNKSLKIRILPHYFFRILPIILLYQNDYVAWESLFSLPNLINALHVSYPYNLQLLRI